jgi:hypothetical protein
MAELVHVYPLFGRAHECSLECWCQPDEDAGVVIHNVEQ